MAVALRGLRPLGFQVRQAVQNERWDLYAQQHGVRLVDRELGKLSGQFDIRGSYGSSSLPERLQQVIELGYVVVDEIVLMIQTTRPTS